MTPRGLIRLARPHQRALAALTALMLAESAVTLVVPRLAGLLAGDVLLTSLGTDWSLVGLIVVALAAIAVLRTASAILSGRIGLAILAELRAMVHDHVVALPLAFHAGNRKGDLMSLMTWEIGQLSSYLTGTLVSILPALVTAGGAVVMMARIDPALALVVPVLVPVFFFVTKLAGRGLRGLSAKVQQAEATVMAEAEQTLEILPAIKSFTREPETAASYRHALDRARRASLAEIVGYAALSPVTQFLAGSAAVVLLALAGRAVAAGGLTAADTISFLLYAALLSRPVATLADVWGRTQVARGVLARLGRVLSTPAESGGDVVLDRARGDIAVHGLQFAYPGRPTVIDGLDLTIPAGEIVALTGANGAGKSTLTALMMGLMRPDAGRITLDGADIATLRLRDLRRQIGHVPQRPLLFNGTIADNIGFGHPDATPDRIRTAAIDAGADDFVRDLPEGYATLIGDNGVRLSGGQGQRVALARALIKDPPILILDEATAMYDLEGESAFVTAAATALAGRTVILITHRPATLALANRILRLQHGRLVTLRATA